MPLSTAGSGGYSAADRLGDRRPGGVHAPEQEQPAGHGEHGGDGHVDHPPPAATWSQRWSRRRPRADDEGGGHGERRPGRCPRRGRRAGPTTPDGEAGEHPGGQGDELAAGEARQAGAVRWSSNGCWSLDPPESLLRRGAAARDADRHRPRSSTPFAGMTRIRFEGLRSPALSALARSPVVPRKVHPGGRCRTCRATPRGSVHAGRVLRLLRDPAVIRLRRRRAGPRPGRDQRSVPAARSCAGSSVCSECPSVRPGATGARAWIRMRQDDSSRTDDGGGRRGLPRLEDHRHRLGGAGRGSRAEGPVGGLEAGDRATSRRPSPRTRRRAGPRPSPGRSSRAPCSASRAWSRRRQAAHYYMRSTGELPKALQREV